LRIQTSFDTPDTPDIPDTPEKLIINMTMEAKRQYRPAITLHEVADRVGMSLRFVREEVRRKKLKAFRPSHNITKVFEDDYERYIEKFSTKVKK